jgi:hypothetical protein
MKTETQAIAELTDAISDLVAANEATLRDLRALREPIYDEAGCVVEGEI